MRVDITRSGTWTTNSLVAIEKILNETIKEHIPKNAKIINIEIKERNGLYRFWIYTLDKQ